MNNDYDNNGFVLINKFLKNSELDQITPTIERFHESWKKDNHSFYHKKAVNSAHLTGTKYLDESDRIKLFQLVSSDKLIDIVSSLPFKQPAFMNTQLFFNPVNQDQKNYWHRDPQYHLSIEEQKQALEGPEVIHFRIALEDEAGIELVPGSHRHWDSEEELNIRLEVSGQANHQEISTGLSIPLEKGDLLAFSANMIHRGLYGNNRMALDILFCEAQPNLIQFVDTDCLPEKEQMQYFENPMPFQNTIRIKSQVCAAAT
jgi:ectoine hydroxylase-related dioxygenase (phytanoyl-CoA dioxygenase family)